MPGFRVLRLLALLVVLSACAPRPEPARRPGPAGAETPGDPAAAPWVLTSSRARHTQQLLLWARLVTEMDTLVREDSVHSALSVEWAVEPDGELSRWSGLVTDFRVRSGAMDSAVVPAGLTLPVRFRAVSAGTGAQPSIVPLGDSACESGDAAIVQGWRELWIAPPSPLHPGTTWQDSTTYTMCRDGIPLRVESVRSYVAESAVVMDGTVHVAVVRRSRVMLEGTGVQFGDTVRIIGGGSSTVRLLLPLTGDAMTGEGEGVLTLELRGRRRTQRLTQESVLEIRAP